MTDITLEDATTAIYASLEQDNLDIDLHIENLKTALDNSGEKTAMFKADKLSQNNRQGRKMMQSYFKKRGVKVSFE